MAEPALHISHAFPVNDHELIVGSKPVSQLAVMAGSTPFFVYDKKVIDSRIAFLRQHLPKRFGLRYALKANPLPDLARHMAHLVDGFDVSSIKEIQTALDAGVKPGTISFSGPGKTEEEIFFAVSSGIVLHLESEQQLVLTCAAGQKLNVRPKVALRVNPDFEIKTSKLKMGGGPKQFGVDFEQAAGMLTKIAETNCAFEGFHVFSGSQNLNADSIIEIFTKSFDMLIRLAQTTQKEIHSLTLGGGFGIPYFPGDKPLDVASIAKALGNPDLKLDQYFPKSQITIELGRYLVGEAGVYICKIIDRKVSYGQVFLVTDGGMNHHLAASGHLGQVIRKNYPVAIANKIDIPPSETVSIVGPLCTPLDLLADRVFLPQAQIGDWVAIFQSGAYGATASPINFLSHPPPKEMLI